jgi:hypothetical protein
MSAPEGMGRFGKSASFDQPADIITVNFVNFSVGQRVLL